MQIEVARQQGPQAFQQLFDQALPQAAELYEQTAQDLPGWHWTACEKCQKWRLVSGACVCSHQVTVKGPQWRLYLLLRCSHS